MYSLLMNTCAVPIRPMNNPDLLEDLYGVRITSPQALAEGTKQSHAGAPQLQSLASGQNTNYRLAVDDDNDSDDIPPVQENELFDDDLSEIDDEIAEDDMDENACPCFCHCHSMWGVISRRIQQSTSADRCRIYLLIAFHRLQWLRANL